MKNKELTQITNAYSKRFKLLNKTLHKNLGTGILLFVEHLKYLRDALLIKAAGVADNEDDAISTIVSSLIIAVAEFEAYQNSKEPGKKDFHWANFCELVKLNMREWLTTNDTV